MLRSPLPDIGNITFYGIVDNEIFRTGRSNDDYLAFMFLLCCAGGAALYFVI